MSDALCRAIHKHNKNIDDGKLLIPANLADMPVNKAFWAEEPSAPEEWGDVVAEAAE